MVMAYVLKLKLPSLKVTQARSDGGVEHRTIPRGCVRKEGADSGHPNDSVIHDNQDNEFVLSDQSHSTMSVSPLEGFGESGQSFDPDQTLPSLHEVREKAAAEGWSRIRMSLLKTTVEGNSMPANQSCILCGSEATHRCLHCAPWAYFCARCFGDAHSKFNIFHVGEIWEVCQVVVINAVFMHNYYFLRMGCTNQLYFQTALLMYDLYIPVQRLHQFLSVV